MAEIMHIGPAERGERLPMVFCGLPCHCWSFGHNGKLSKRKAQGPRPSHCGRWEIGSVRPMRRDKDRLRRVWGISERRGATLREDLQIFLGDLRGFCGATVSDVLTGEEPLTAEAFAHAVLLAEGWPDPASEYEYRPQIVRLFTERYGPSISPRNYSRTSAARCLISTHCGHRGLAAS